MEPKSSDDNQMLKNGGINVETSNGNTSNFSDNIDDSDSIKSCTMSTDSSNSKIDSLSDTSSQNQVHSSPVQNISAESHSLPPIDNQSTSESRYPVSTHESTDGDVTSTLSSGRGAELPLDELPPPPDVYDDINDDQFMINSSLPPAPTFDDNKSEDDSQMASSSNSDELQYKKTAVGECLCDRFKPSTDINQPFFARYSV